MIAASVFDTLTTGLLWAGAAIAVVLLFGFTIFVHELGHFLAARLCGLVVDTFSLGFGPAIWKRQVGGTEYKVCWIPLGGYVALPQLDPTGMQTIQGGGDEPPLRQLEPAAWWKRIVVSVCGPFGNVVFGFLLALIIWAAPPEVEDSLKFAGVVVGDVEEASAAQAAGFRIGDRILAVNGRPVETWDAFITESYFNAADGFVQVSVSNALDGAVATIQAPTAKDRLGHDVVKGLAAAHRCAVGELLAGMPAERAGLAEEDVLLAIDGREIHGVGHAIALIRASEGRPLAIDYLRKGARFSASVAPERKEDGVWMIGCTLAMRVVSVPMWMQFRHPLDQIMGDVAAVKRVLVALVTPKQTGKVGKALGGPVMIVSSLWLSILSGLAGALCFVRFLNINLAMLNLLPLPVLDGGHIVFALWRGVFRREVPAKVVNALVNVFAVLLIGVFVLITFRDVLNLNRIFGRRDRDASALEQLDEPEAVAPEAPTAEPEAVPEQP